jgi:hypothetical protein
VRFRPAVMRMDATRAQGAANVLLASAARPMTKQPWSVDSGGLSVPLLFPWVPIARHPGRLVHPGRPCAKGFPCPALRRPFGPGPGLPVPLAHAPAPARPWCCAPRAVQQAKEMEW